MEIILVFFCEKTNEFKQNKVDLDASNLTLNHLKNVASNSFNLQVEEIDVVFHGEPISDLVLPDRISSGTILHIMASHRSNHVLKPNNCDPSPQALSQLKTFRKAFLSGSNKQLMKLCEPDSLKQIIDKTPGLKEDRIAQRLLSDFKLMGHILEPACLHKLQQDHPCLIEALLTMGNQWMKSVPSFYEDTFGGIDGLLSDDDELEGFDSTNAAAGGTADDNYNTSFSSNFITATQLAAALAAAGARMGSSSNANSGAGPSQVPSVVSNYSNSPLVTPEMFDIALQQALANSTETTTNRDQEAQLREMRELGITDDAISLRALEATGGNVDAAVGLIFGDWMDESY